MYIYGLVRTTHIFIGPGALTPYFVLRVGHKTISVIAAFSEIYTVPAGLSNNELFSFGVKKTAFFS